MRKLIKKFQYPAGPISPNYPAVQDLTAMYTNYFDKSIKNTLKLPTGSFKGDPMVMGKLQLETPKLKSMPAKATGNANIGGVSNMANILGGLSDTLTDINTSIPYYGEQSGLTSGLNTAYGAVSKVAAQFGPIGQAASGVMQVGSMIGKGLDALTGGATTTSGKTTIDSMLNSDFFKLTGIGLVNSIGGKKSKKYSKDLTSQINLGYTGASGAEQAKYGLFSGSARRRATRLNQRTDAENLNKLSAIYQGKQENLASINTSRDLSARYEQDLLAGVNYSPLSAKGGAKINPVQLRNLVKKTNSKKKKEEEVNKFAEGGQLNVIPDGALHKSLNHLDGDLGEAVTSKGIPVITYDDGGEITQHAEIEKNEIIFNKQTTDMLESLFKKYNEVSDKEKDALAIEAGKFLTTEILENTDDRTGLLNEIE